MDYSFFRSNLRNLLDSRSLTIKEFGEQTNITSATLSRYLSGQRTPDLIYVVKIANYFNVSIDWLLGISGEKFDIMPREVQEVAYRYQLASPDDRKVVQAVLSKYGKG